MNTIILSTVLMFGGEWRFPVADDAPAIKSETAVVTPKKFSADNPEVTVKVYDGKGIICTDKGCTQFDLSVAQQLDTPEYTIIVSRKVKSQPQQFQQYQQPPPQFQPQYIQQPMYFMGGNCATGNCSTSR